LPNPPPRGEGMSGSGATVSHSLAFGRSGGNELQGWAGIAVADGKFVAAEGAGAEAVRVADIVGALEVVLVGAFGAGHVHDLVHVLGQGPEVGVAGVGAVGLAAFGAAIDIEEDVGALADAQRLGIGEDYQ